MRQGRSAPVPGLSYLIRRCGDNVRLRESVTETGQAACGDIGPIGTKRDLAASMLTWGARKLSSSRRTMSSGRSERRITKALSVEVCVQDEPKLNEMVLTENVSAHGARILAERKLQPGQRVLVSSPKEGVRSQARIVYCQRVSEREFAVGLEMTGRMELWAKPY